MNLDEIPLRPDFDTKPDYFDTWKEHYPKINSFGIERSILRHWKREWSQSGKGPYGSTWADHFCRYTRQATPQIEITPWFYRMAHAFEKTCLIDGKKIINFIGSRSSGKTDFNATFSINMTSIWPEMTTAYVAAPYIKAAHSTVWARCITRFNQIKSAQPETFGKAFQQKAMNRLVFDDMPQSGFLELVTIDDVGKLQGIKSVHPTKGWLILLCDEVALFKKKELLEVFGNITENANFICFTGCNFRDKNGLEGDLCEPEGREYEELDVELDQDWPSNHKSHTWRFDGHQSPNILAGETIYPYLLKAKGRQDMEEIHGLEGPKYMEQIRSFPIGSATEFYVTTRNKVKASGAYDDCVFVEEKKKRVGFCDPGFGGDPCKIGCFDFGEALVPTLSGNYATRLIFQPVQPFDTIQIEAGKICDEEWINRILAVRGNLGDMRIERDKELTPEQQIALKAAEYCKANQIPYERFGFDGSMRASIVTEMIVMMGNSVHAIDFGGVATDRRGDLTSTKKGKDGREVPKTAADLYFNFVTELYFTFGHVVQAQQFRGAEHVQAAINQICRRWWEYSGNRKKIQPKTGKGRDDDKQSYIYQNGRSPDDGDTLCGGLEMAKRFGFWEDRARSGEENPSSSTSQIARAIAESPRFRKRGSAKLRGGKPKPRMRRNGMMR